MKRSTVLFSSFMLASGILAGLVALKRGVVHAAATPAIPATIGYLTQVVDASDNSVKDTETSTMYIRGDGGTVTITKRPWTGPASAGLDSFERRLIIDGVQQVSLYPALKLKTTLPIDVNQVDQYLLRSTPYCGAGIAAQDGDVLGNTVYRIEAPATESGQSKRLRSTVWRAPALGCAQLRSVTEIIDPTGSVIGRTIKTAVSIKLGNPDLTLFSIPSDFTEAPPSQTMTALATLKGKECPECARNTGARADASYFRKRQAK